MKPLTSFIITIFILTMVVLVMLLVILGPLSQEPGHGAEIRQEKVLKDNATIIIENNTFNPANLTILAGTTVTWKNPSGNSQTNSVVSDKLVNGTRFFDSGPIRAGGSFNFTFTQVGNFTYNSGIQYFANGSVIVIPNVPETFPAQGQGSAPQGYPPLALRAH